MAKFSGDPPPSTDLEGWRQAIAEGRLRKFRPEALAAAFQDLGEADRHVRQHLMKHLSGAIVGTARNGVDVRKPNFGRDILWDVHEVIVRALMNPGSADGKQLRKGFGGIVNFRVKDAIARSDHDQIVPAPKPSASFKAKVKAGKAKIKKTAEQIAEELDEAASALEQAAADSVENKTEEEEAAPDAEHVDNRPPPYAVDEAEDDAISPGKSSFDPALMAVVRDMDTEIDRQRILAKIPDHVRRLAFSLHMDGEKQADIAEACGVSTRTIRTWIDEIQQDLQQTKEAQELLGRRAGAKS